jgi:hypothetical protein
VRGERFLPHRGKTSDALTSLLGTYSIENVFLLELLGTDQNVGIS